MHSVKEIKVKAIPWRICAQLIEKNHYSHRYPGATQVNLGAFLSQRLIGCLTFGLGVCVNYKNFVRGSTEKNYFELTRLWVEDAIGKNAESRIVKVSLFLIKKFLSRIKWILSFADENYGHRGIIYQACNFIYTGIGGTTPALKFSDGTIKHRRTLGKKFGSSSIEYWRQFDKGVTETKEKGKHRYIYFLDKRWRDKLVLPSLPYPKQAGMV